MVMRREKRSPTLNASEDIHMAELYFDKEAKLWRADKVDFGTGSISVRIRFAHSGNTTLGYVKADGKDIGVIALSGLVCKITKNYLDRQKGLDVEPMLSAFKDEE